MRFFFYSVLNRFFECFLNPIINTDNKFCHDLQTTIQRTCIILEAKIHRGYIEHSKMIKQFLNVPTNTGHLNKLISVKFLSNRIRWYSLELTYKKGKNSFKKVAQFKNEHTFWVNYVSGFIYQIHIITAQDLCLQIELQIFQYL